MFLRQTSRSLQSASRAAPLWRRQFTRTAAMASSTGTSVAPVEDTIRQKITENFEPTRLEIYNDSHLHRHHKAMADSTSAETHFRLVITSSKFQGTPQIRRHRMINEVLKEDLAREGGIHALQLKTMTPEEEKRMEENSTK